VASISKRPNGHKRLHFTDAEGIRRTIYLGKIDIKTAETIRHHVEVLIACQTSGSPVPPATAQWLAEIPDWLHEKLAKAGLVESRKRVTVAEFAEKWLAEKKSAGLARTTVTAARTGIRYLVELFGDRPLEAITLEDAQRYRGYLQSRGLRPATVHRRINWARQLFGDAIKLGLIDKNPFQHVQVATGDISERRVYVPVDQVLRVIDYCPNIWWKLLVVLARFGGLRIPSEAFSLRWQDVDGERGRLVVPSPKTERQGKPFRVIPLFPVLYKYLAEAFDAAEEGAEYVFPYEYRRRSYGPNGWVNTNLRTTFQKIIRRAGVEPWPKLFQNLRSSFESDLATEFPLSVVTKWLGNTPSVALRHYVDPTDEAFQRALSWTPGVKTPGVAATRIATQQGEEIGRITPQTENGDKIKALVLQGLTKSRDMVQKPQVGGTGFETNNVTSSTASTYDKPQTQGNAHCNARSNCDTSGLLELLQELAALDPETRDKLLVILKRIKPGSTDR